MDASFSVCSACGWREDLERSLSLSLKFASWIWSKCGALRTDCERERHPFTDNSRISQSEKQWRAGAGSPRKRETIRRRARIGLRFLTFRGLVQK